MTTLVGQDSQRAGAHDGWAVNWEKRLAQIGRTPAEIVSEEWVVEGRGDADPADLVKTFEVRTEADHRIWLTSLIGNAAYDVTSWIELPPPGGGAPNLKLDATIRVRIDP